MNGLLVRVAADSTTVGGSWNGPVDSNSNEFVFVPITDSGPFRKGLATPYQHIRPLLGGRWPDLPTHLHDEWMHLDPDFSHLTYGDGGSRATQIRNHLGEGDLIVFFAGLRDINPNPRLVYAIIGLYVVDEILVPSDVPRSRRHENAHTRRQYPGEKDIVVRAKRGVSGRLVNCLPIGDFRPPADRPRATASYRVSEPLLRTWGGLSMDYIQRSARLPRFLNAKRFYKWFLHQGATLVPRNN